MQYKKINDQYLLCFELGEELVTVFTNFCQEQDISAGFFHGLGGATKASIGYYDLTKKEYRFTDCDDVAEIISLNGNISQKDGAPMIHVHGTLGNDKLEAIAGHIQSLTVGGTAEIFLTPFHDPIERKYDEATGLNLLKL